MIRFAFQKVCWAGLDFDQSWKSAMDTKNMACALLNEMLGRGE